MIWVLPVTVKPFQFSPAEPVAYELRYMKNHRTIKVVLSTPEFNVSDSQITAKYMCPA
jgi:hypothetical protein